MLLLSSYLVIYICGDLSVGVARWYEAVDVRLVCRSYASSLVCKWRLVQLLLNEVLIDLIRRADLSSFSPCDFLPHWRVVMRFTWTCLDTCVASLNSFFVSGWKCRVSVVTDEVLATVDFELAILASTSFSGARVRVSFAVCRAFQSWFSLDTLCGLSFIHHVDLFLLNLSLNLSQLVIQISQNSLNVDVFSFNCNALLS